MVAGETWRLRENAMEIFIGAILIIFMLLFLALSVPMKNVEINAADKRKSQTMQQVK